MTIVGCRFFPPEEIFLLIFTLYPCIIDVFREENPPFFHQLAFLTNSDQNAGGIALSSSSFRPIGPTTFLAPVPCVLLSCRGTQEGFDRSNLITVAWAGVVNSAPPMISVSIRPERHSYAQIRQSGAFCLNLIGRALCRAADYCGVKSGRDIDKFAELGLHAREVEGFPAPALDEAPAFLCCRVRQVIPLSSHDLFLCEVEQVYVRDTLFDADGSLHLSRAKLAAYAHGEYYPLASEPEGFFGYSVARPEVLKKRLPAKHQEKGAGRKPKPTRRKRP